MISHNEIFAIALFALATSATPGPVNVISPMFGARLGLANTVPYVMGATTIFVAFLVTIGTGIGFILEIVTPASIALGVIGSVYLIWLAIKIARADGRINIDSSDISRRMKVNIPGGGVRTRTSLARIAGMSGHEA